MQTSHYLKAYQASGGRVVLFSTLTTALAVVEEDVWKRMREGSLSQSELEAFSGTGFLVEDREAEKAAVSRLPERRNAASTMLNLLAVMNMDCNLSCVYCYEGNMKGKHYMSGETAERLLAFISERLTPDKKLLNIDFYGGEPLLSLDLIKTICRKAGDLSRRKGVDFTFSLTTNGTLLTRKVVDELVPLGLKGTRVTLDGPGEIHDRYRPFRNGRGSFETIIRNIRDVCEVTRISIGGNYDRDSWDRFPELLDFLIEQGLTPDKIASVKFDPIAQPEERCLPEFRDGCMSTDEPWLWKASLELRDEIMKRGFRTPPISPTFCVVYNDSHFVVNHDGTLLKCPGFLGREELACGSIFEGLAECRAGLHLDSWKNEECMDCAYLPLCFGGCRYMKLLRDGDMSEVDCRKPFLDATLEEFIGQEIRYGSLNDGD
jgi:uncharacterized protein